MPVNAAAAQVTDRYRDGLLALRHHTILVLDQLWAGIDPALLDISFLTWLRAASELLTGAQRQAVVHSDAYLARYLGASLHRPVGAQGLNTTAYAGRSRDGRPVVEVLRPALFTVKLTIRQGHPIDQALTAGRARARRVMGAELVATARSALGDAMRQDTRVEGWRRVSAFNACGACLASATGAIHHTDDFLHNHDGCRCTAEPVVRGVTETVRRPTGRQIFDAKTKAEQAALFNGRGGAEKANLIRSGAVPFDALIDTSPMAVIPDQITETPLVALKTMA